MARNTVIGIDVNPVQTAGFTLSGGATSSKSLNNSVNTTFSGADMTFTGSGTNTYTFPSATDTLVGIAAAQTLTNKTIGASTTSFPALKFSSGTAPTTPAAGDLWWDGSALNFRGASSTVNLLAATGGGGITWNNVTGTTQAASINNGYIANNAALVTVTLPSTAAVGSVVRVAGAGAGGWRIAQNASQLINFGTTVTTTGTGGRLDSTNRYDAVELLCVTANTTWTVISSVGNINIT